MDHEPGLFGTLLRQRRTAAALSQEALAERAGLSPRGISDLERGVRRVPHLTTVGLLADALELAPEQRKQLLTAARPGSLPETPGDAGDRSMPLPTPPTPLLGRKQEMASLTALLADAGVRLITLTGAGGSGKTRLALEIAAEAQERYADGVVFFDLSPIRNAELVLPTIAGVLDVRETSNETWHERLRRTLHDRRLLMVLDNCEQVLSAAPDLTTLLTACPTLTILATSREAWRLRGEQEFPVAPLARPGPGVRSLATLACVPAVALFVERARASDPGFVLTEENSEAVVDICHRLDGLPLAIELAAVRVKMLPPQALNQRLVRSLPLLTSGRRDAPMRQRTLRDTIAWSYDLLTVEERAVFRRLGIFAGGWTLEAAETVVNLTGDVDALNGLGLLIDKSLVRIGERGLESRYSLLETVREFAQDALDEAGERGAVQDRHAAHYLVFAERGARELEGPQQRVWLGLLEREHPNLRQAFATLEERGDSVGFVRLANALSFFWFCHSHTQEGAQRLARALALERNGASTRARTLAGCASLAYASGAYGNALRWLAESEALARELGDNSLLSFVMLFRGLVAEHIEDEATAKFCFEEALALAQLTGSAWLSALALPNLSDAVYRYGDLDLAERFAQAASHAIRESGNAYMESMNLGNLANVALARGDVHRAAVAMLDALVIAQEIDSLWNVANVIAGAAAVSAARGFNDQAARLLGAADAAREVSGHPRLPGFRGYEQTTERVRNTIGDDAYCAAWEAGRALAIDDAVGQTRAVLQDTGVGWLPAS